MRRNIAILSTLLLCQLTVYAQKRPVFWGINPSITVELPYLRGELDVNMLPVNFQTTLHPRLHLRVGSLLNYGFRSTGNGISHYGFEIATPVFLKAKANPAMAAQGWYLAPIISLSHNPLGKHRNTGLWLEPGFHWLFEDRFALFFGLQFGTTYFNYQNQQNGWGQHFGANVIFGRWRKTTP